ncbi:acetyltransferase [Actinobacillus seminis]|uniref:tRNA(Met) cytidine acetyltransferase TmcA n=2 Tax=Actinobacillus seminis TaxID=722 RepID=A0A380VCE0_9PAST|nr:GNAT family N-acetyltransferase [Actinobacillus seminis]SUU35200.1 acetyltransferase [Actinobacillus seminis]
MSPRQLTFLVQADIRPFCHHPHLLWVGMTKPDVADFQPMFYPFSQAQNLLGQSFGHIVFDAREGMDLAALAIVCGTLVGGGRLWVLVPAWEEWEPLPDQDSLRWSGESSPIATPHFVMRLKQCIRQYGFSVLKPNETTISAVDFSPIFVPTTVHRATPEQQEIIRQILLQQSELYFLTAKRGRGKSALLGLLADKLIDPLYLTAPNKNAVHTLKQFSTQMLNFIAPDKLAAQLQRAPQHYQDAWLLVDEAAMIPLPLLAIFAQHFKHVIFSTTTHSYEGTGRGFSLKFQQEIDRTFTHFTLTQPLRWEQNDPIEAFLETLLLLDIESQFPALPYFQPASIHIRPYLPAEVAKQPDAFYALLTQAHYRTSPIDLRRLLDAPKQAFVMAKVQAQLLGGIWAVHEGGMQDSDLVGQIRRGQRRPKGNLAAQVLAFQWDLAAACELTSLRISRIAVQPAWRQKTLGQQLVHALQKTTVDFLSVSFGYHPKLWAFWQKCGFVLAHIGEHQEASSGHYAAIALYPLTAAGDDFCQVVAGQFQRDMALSFHPLATTWDIASPDWTLQAEDWRYLQNFANFHRTLVATIPSLRRLARHYELENTPLLQDFLRYSGQNPCIMGNMGKKDWLKKVRLEIKVFLQQLSYSEI